MITFEETGTTQPNCEDLDGTSVFKSTSGSDLNISHLEKYIDWKYSKTVRPAQTKTEGCCSEDKNCSTSLFNDQNNKQYGSFPQNKPTLREHIIPSDVDFDIVQTTPLEERPGNITNSSFTGFLLQQIEFMREEARFKNFIIERLFTTNSLLRDNQFFSCKSEHIKIPFQSCSDKSNDTSDIPLGKSGLNRINHYNNNFIDDPIENFIYSGLDITDEPKESLSDNII